MFGAMASACMMVLLLLSPGACSEAARRALSVWGMDVVPSLFPYMVFCRMLSARLVRFGLSPHFVIPVLGLAGGSPAGASVIAAYTESGKLTVRQCRAFSALVGTLSPMFLLGTVNAWFGGNGFGTKLLLSNLFAAVCSALLVYNAEKHNRTPVCHPSEFSSAEASEPIFSSVQAILNVGGCIVFFSVLAECLRLLLPGMPESAFALCSGLLEISGGLHALARTALTQEGKLLLAAALTGFGGFSIMAQNLIFLAPIGVSGRKLASCCILRALLSTGFMILIMRPEWL